MIRKLLGLKKSKEIFQPLSQGLLIDGVLFPDGTDLQKLYKNKRYNAKITAGKIILDGKTFTSASAAAFQVTGSNVNGLNFWKCRVPGKREWVTIKQFIVSQSLSLEALGL